MMFRSILFCLLFMLPFMLPFTGFSQEISDEVVAENQIEKMHFGVRVNWGLQIPGRNLIGGQEIQLVRAGNRLGGGGFLLVSINQKVQFAPFVGVNYVSFRKGQQYKTDCEIDSFPTYHSFYDSLPGRDLRFFYLTIEPAFKVRLSRIHIDLKFSPIIHFPIRAAVEDYVHTCGATGNRGFVAWENSPERKKRPVLIGGSISINRDINLSKNFSIFLEPGFEGYINSLVETEASDIAGGTFNLKYFGFFLNLGFFR